MTRHLITLLLCITPTVSFATVTAQTRESMFIAHARCAALYGILWKNSPSQKYNQHYSAQVEVHAKMASNLAPDASRFQYQFETEAEWLKNQILSQKSVEMRASFIQSQTEKCVDAVTQYGKFTGAIPKK